MIDVNTTISMITLDVQGLNPVIKRQRLSEQIKTRLDHSLLKESHFKYKDSEGLKVRRWKKICHINTKRKKAGVAILISDKAKFRARRNIKGKEGHCIIIRLSVFPEGNFLCVCA